MILIGYVLFQIRLAVWQLKLDMYGLLVIDNFTDFLSDYVATLECQVCLRYSH